MINQQTNDIKISEVREPVISNSTYKELKELMRFRHFKRYYFELDYDWDKLDFLSIKFEKVYTLMIQDLSNFKKFLIKISE